MHSIRAAVAVFAFAALSLTSSCLAALAQNEPAAPQYPNYPSETPRELQPATTGFDYARREAMIPMRDGVQLHTVILVPKGAQHAPILLTRTPYGADQLTTHVRQRAPRAHLYGYDNATDVIVEGGYIRVVQDIRGKYGSEGDYVMNRPLHGPLNPTPVDEATDTYDTIDWLVKNIPETNGKVGILGISYDGFLPLDGACQSASRAQSGRAHESHGRWLDGRRLVPQRRLPRAEHALHLRAGRHARQRRQRQVVDRALRRLRRVHERRLGGRTGPASMAWSRWASGKKSSRHPAYDSFWSDQAVDKVLADDFKREGIKVPIMLVHSLWDQEDIYGAPAVYKAIKPLDTNNDKVFMVLGPWHHGQEIEDAASLGAIRFGSDTGTWFRQNVLRPFLDHYLKDDAPADNVAPITVFETGINRWQNLQVWPVAPATKPLYLEPGFRLAFAPPGASTANAASSADSDHTSLTPPSPYLTAPVLASPSATMRHSPGPVACRRPARSLGPHRCAHLHVRCAHRADPHHRPSRSPISSPPPAALTPTGWSS